MGLDVKKKHFERSEIGGSGKNFICVWKVKDGEEWAWMSKKSILKGAK